LVTHEAARLSEGDKGAQERADALEACLRQAEQARQAREVAEGSGCKCDGDRTCRIDALVKGALDGDGECVPRLLL
jgi:hypothetical protein